MRRLMHDFDRVVDIHVGPLEQAQAELLLEDAPDRAVHPSPWTPCLRARRR